MQNRAGARPGGVAREAAAAGGGSRVPGGSQPAVHGGGPGGPGPVPCDRDGPGWARPGDLQHLRVLAHSHPRVGGRGAPGCGHPPARLEPPRDPLGSCGAALPRAAAVKPQGAVSALQGEVASAPRGVAPGLSPGPGTPGAAPGLEQTAGSGERGARSWGQQLYLGRMEPSGWGRPRGSPEPFGLHGGHAGGRRILQFPFRSAERFPRRS